ncbi:MAG: YraN family protein, partial [Rhodospirillaceae bacterium]|nr:YraN family protein [Rhodospirillaceae bacterium]
MSKPKPQTGTSARKIGGDAHRRGRRTETWAKWWLRIHGYKVVCQNFKTAQGEIDIIATRGGVLSFVEVKMRSNMDDAFYAISSGQKKRIERAAEHFLKKHPKFSSSDI